MRLILAVASLALAAGCAGDYRFAQAHYDREQLQAGLQDEQTGILIGEFPLADHAVVDGDTIKVDGLDASLRLLGIDTEETFKSEKDLRLYDQGFEKYLEKKRGNSDRPIKAATPLGMEAKAWGEDFFRGVTTVRLERDDPHQIRGAYNRFLAYVLVDKAGELVNYNVEVVRAGMSPYFTKYGYSRRFHEEFVAAQQEARAAGIGIWDPEKEHYRDYEERLAWWNARAEVIKAFEDEADGDPTWISLSDWDAMERLADLEGQEVVLLGAVGDIRPREGRAPARVLLSRRLFDDFPLVFFDDDVLEDSHVEDAKGEFVRVRGTVSRYTFKRKRKRAEPRSQLQIEVKRPDQIRFVDTRPSTVFGPAAAAPEPEPEPVPEPVPEPGPPPPPDPAHADAPADAPTDDAPDEAGPPPPPPPPAAD